ncbi:MAG TPA: DUF3106 domain-containing protein [Candidatus Binatia bacterium]
MKTRNRLLVTIGFVLLFGANALAQGNDWRKLDPKEKDRIRRNYERWEKLPPKDKEHLREEWDRWNRMPQDRRDQLKRRFQDNRRSQD